MTRATKKKVSHRHFVLAVIFLVAAFDIVVGLKWLLHAEPWAVNGQEARWIALPVDLTQDAALQRYLRESFFRLGAYSFHAGVVALAWGFFARKSWSLLSVLLAAYTLNSVLFAYADLTFLTTSSYVQLRQALGLLWILAIVSHFLDRPSSKKEKQAEEASVS